MRTNEELLAELPAPAADAPFKLDQVTDVNFKPHPYTIGGRHVAHASDHFLGMLGEAAILDGERKGIHCAHTRCTVSYKNHTWDKVAVITVPADAEDLNTVPGLHAYLLSIKDKANELKIDGFAFAKAA